MHRWRIGDRAASSRKGALSTVASPQSLTLLLPAPQPYRRRALFATRVGHRSYALENPFWACEPPLREHFPDEPRKPFRDERNGSKAPPDGDRLGIIPWASDDAKYA